MIHRIKNIFNSAVCEVSILLIVCCLIVLTLSIRHSGAWTNIAIVSCILGGIILVSLLAWATFSFIAKKEIREMPKKSRMIVECISRVAFLFWIYIAMGPLLAMIWAILIVWDGIRSFKQIVR